MGRRQALVVGVAFLLAVLLGVALAIVLPTTPTRAQGKPPVVAAALPEGYVGPAACKDCHEESYEKFAGTRMGRIFLHQPRDARERLGCESCHGPGKAHAEAGGDPAKSVGFITFAKKDRTPVDRRNQVCLDCHQKGNRLFWNGSAHEARNVACTSCHRLMEDHSPKAQLARPTELETCGSCHLKQRAQQMRTSHMPVREGKMTCTSCHNPHGTVTPALLREPSLNDTCYRCHAEKRGPFLWPHAPVVESCANCHEPHGSNHENMLKMVKPRLCQTCHIESRHPTSPYNRDTASFRFVLGRQCVTCHAKIHGSNHPSGFAFTR